MFYLIQGASLRQGKDTLVNQKHRNRGDGQVMRRDHPTEAVPKPLVYRAALSGHPHRRLGHPSQRDSPPQRERLMPQRSHLAPITGFLDRCDDSAVAVDARNQVVGEPQLPPRGGLLVEVPESGALLLEDLVWLCYVLVNMAARIAGGDGGVA